MAAPSRASAPSTPSPSSIREVEWGTCLLEPRRDREVERRFRRETGRPDKSVRHFVGVPWLDDAMIELSAQMGTHVAIDPDLADLAGMVVSQDNSCRYCFAATRALLRILGVPQRRITQLERDLLTADFSPKERAALRFARRLSRSNPLLGAGDLDALREAGFDELQIAELAGVVGLHLFANRMSTLSALPPQQMEELPDSRLVRWLRPLVALRLRRVRRRASPVSLDPDEARGPFAHVIEGLDGLPLASALRRAVDGLCGSGVLPRRTKALFCAVVARSLGCERSEQEAADMLRADGLEAESIDEILAHLASPELDPVERLALPFARETVWYQPARIQERARELRQALSREQFLELIAAAALSNMLCRLGVLAHRRA